MGQLRTQPYGIWHPGDYYGLAHLESSYSTTLKDHIKQYPGRKWLKDCRRWQVPEDVMPLIMAQFPEYDWQSQLPTASYDTSDLHELLKPYQREGVANILARRCYLLQYDTGIGKSPTALQAAKIANAQKVLILSPANVVEDWQEHIENWGGGSRDEIALFTASKKSINTQKKFTICTYGLMKYVEEWTFDYIIFDELHYLLKSTSQRSKRAAAVSRANAEAIRVGLTATPVSSELYNIWHQIDVLCPGRLGSYWTFVKHYFETDNEGWEGALQIHGLNPNRVAELQQRLDYFSAVVRKEEAYRYLPPLKLHLNWYGTAKWKASEVALSAWMEEQNGLRDGRVQEAMRIGTKPKRLFVTYLRKTAENIGAALDIPFTHGGSTPKARRKALLENDCAVVTMDAIREGINYLVKFTDVHFMEVYPAPIKMIQTIGRFNRLNSTEAADITIHGSKGSSDEIICLRLHARMQQQQRLWEGGLERKLTDALAVDTNDEEFLAEINEAVLCMVEDDGFGDFDD